MRVGGRVDAAVGGARGRRRAPRMAQLLRAHPPRPPVQRGRAERGRAERGRAERGGTAPVPLLLAMHVLTPAAVLTAAAVLTLRR